MLLVICKKRVESRHGFGKTNKKCRYKRHNTKNGEVAVKKNINRSGICNKKAPMEINNK